MVTFRPNRNAARAITPQPAAILSPPEWPETCRGMPAEPKTTMQVLRVGGQYLATRRRNIRAALVTIVGTGVVGMAVLWTIGNPTAGMALGVSTALVVAKVKRRLDRVIKGIKGEVLVAECLESLPDDYFLLNDVALQGHPGNIDHVVIGPCGVVVIETKNFSGSVYTHRNAWFANGRRCRSVSRQANRGAVAVRDTLVRRHPQLKSSVLRFVDSIAVFTNPTTRVKVDQAQTIVVRYSQLLDVIREIARRKRMPAHVAGKLAEDLKALASSERAAKEVIRTEPDLLSARQRATTTRPNSSVGGART